MNHVFFKSFLTRELQKISPMWQITNKMLVRQLIKDRAEVLRRFADYLSEAVSPVAAGSRRKLGVSMLLPRRVTVTQMRSSKVVVFLKKKRVLHVIVCLLPHN